jgi:hypothetical protein
LQHTGDERSGEQSFQRRPGNAPQNRAHALHGEVLNAVGHEFQAEHENAQAADDRDSYVFEYVNCHPSPSSMSAA